VKSTGVVRKIDELGRIVIPKEIRRNLNIKDNEEVEIFVDSENIILKKYYRLLTLKEIAQKYVSILEKFITSPLFITDREKIILSSKEAYSIYVNQPISKTITDYINDRKAINEKGKLNITSSLMVEGNYFVIPILVNADSIGSFICFNNEAISEKTLIIVEIINILLKSQLEN
jgi:AbrB family transcriptional regulator (stage V sporulation protein T)